MLSIDGLDSVIAVLEQENGETRRMQLALAYMENNNFTVARQILDSMALVAGFENFAAINHIITDILEDSATFDTLLADTALRQTVEGIAADTLKFGYLSARAILSAVFDSIFPVFIDSLVIPQLKTGNTNTQYDDVVVNDPAVTNVNYKRENEPFYHLTNYPNPFSEGTIIAAMITPELQPGEVVVYDIMGNEVMRYKLKSGQNFIEISGGEFSQSVYFYSLISKGVKLEIKKMIQLK